MATSKATATQQNDMRIGAVQHFEIVCPDAPKLRKFLEKQFGWTFETMKMAGGTDYHVFRTPGNTGGGGIMEPIKEGQPLGVFPYINVADVKVALKNAQKAGATICMPLTEVPGQGWFFQLQYADGPILACWQQTGPVR